jgi:hypothetical protein
MEFIVNSLNGGEKGGAHFFAPFLLWPLSSLSVSICIYAQRRELVASTGASVWGALASGQSGVKNIKDKPVFEFGKTKNEL